MEPSEDIVGATDLDRAQTAPDANSWDAALQDRTFRHNPYSHYHCRVECLHPRILDHLIPSESTALVLMNLMAKRPFFVTEENWHHLFLHAEGKGEVVRRAPRRRNVYDQVITKKALCLAMNMRVSANASWSLHLGRCEKDPETKVAYLTRAKTLQPNNPRVCIELVYAVQAYQRSKNSINDKEIVSLLGEVLATKPALDPNSHAAAFKLLAELTDRQKSRHKDVQLRGQEHSAASLLRDAVALESNERDLKFCLAQHFSPWEVVMDDLVPIALARKAILDLMNRPLLTRPDRTTKVVHDASGVAKLVWRYMTCPVLPIHPIPTITTGRSIPSSSSSTATSSLYSTPFISSSSSENTNSAKCSDLSSNVSSVGYEDAVISLAEFVTELIDKDPHVDPLHLSMVERNKPLYDHDALLASALYFSNNIPELHDYFEGSQHSSEHVCLLKPQDKPHRSPTVRSLHRVLSHIYGIKGGGVPGEEDTFFVRALRDLRGAKKTTTQSFESSAEATWFNGEARNLADLDRRDLEELTSWSPLDNGNIRIVRMARVYGEVHGTLPLRGMRMCISNPLARVDQVLGVDGNRQLSMVTCTWKERQAAPPRDLGGARTPPVHQYHYIHSSAESTPPIVSASSSSFFTEAEGGFGVGGVGAAENCNVLSDVWVASIQPHAAVALRTTTRTKEIFVLDRPKDEYSAEDPAARLRDATGKLFVPDTAKLRLVLLTSEPWLRGGVAAYHIVQGSDSTKRMYLSRDGTIRFGENPSEGDVWYIAPDEVHQEMLHSALWVSVRDGILRFHVPF